MRIPFSRFGENKVVFEKMADPKKKVAGSAPGNYFVDTTCIDCDTCRQLAPDVFGDGDGYAIVRAQPKARDVEIKALYSLLSCPTGSIGTEEPNDAKEVRKDFPLMLDDDVYYCGFNSKKSYGGNSYFIKHTDGNWMIDSPKYLPFLKDQISAMGGLKYIFLTHSDDVADAHRYAEAFGAERFIHEKEVHAQPEAECILSVSDDGRELGKGIRVILTPGHTEGHMSLLYQNKFLFTGDHLSWDRNGERLRASKQYNWFSWEDQLRSIEKLKSYVFEWILPGHGQRVQLKPGASKKLIAEFLLRT